MSNLSVFRYPGAKNKLIPKIMEHLTPLLVSNQFCEPFVGGGSVVLDVAQNYPGMQLYINDKDYWIYCFWKVVSEGKKVDELLGKMSVQPTIDLFYNLRVEKSMDEVQCAYKAIFFNRTAFSGILKSGPIGGKEQKSKYKVDCRYNYNKLSAKILDISKLLNGRTVVDNKDVVDYIKDKDMPMYLDPPYYQKGSALYFETMSAADHLDLRNALDNKNKWLLSYDKDENIMEMYKTVAGADIMDLSVIYCIDGQKKNWKNNSEYLILKNENTHITKALENEE